MTPDSGKPRHGWGITIKSLAVGIFVFLIGREMAVWLAARNVHGFLAFLDNVLAAIAASLVVLIYELRRQRGVDQLRESEQRFRLVADAAPVLIWMSGIDKLCTYFNKPWLDFTGRPLAEELGNGWASGVHPDDFQRCLNTYTQSFDQREKFGMEYRLRRHDGEYRWIFDIGVPRYRQQGSFGGYIGSCVDITERKQAEQVLQETNRALDKQTALLRSREELLKIFVKNVPAGVAMFDRDMRYLKVSDRWCADFSLDSSQIIGRSHHEVFPDIPERWKQLLRRALNGETLRADEDGWDRKDGTTWLRWEIRPWHNIDGSPGGILIFSEDITRRKRMEEALSGVSRKLIQAQEQERARIARELHDDISQRLAMLAIEIEKTQDHLPEMPSKVWDWVHKLSMRTKEISNDIQALSHELHSSKLDYLGLAGGMKSWCNEFGERRGMEIEFKSSGFMKSLAPEISLCLFRVLQEALHNAFKHSGVTRVDVQLWEESGEIQLIVSDSGIGFDVAATMQDRGLGVTSMQERVRQVGGKIAIDSKPLGGTTVHVRVPFAAERSSQVTAG
jgi:PAS domain S-box-containing protein